MIKTVKQTKAELLKEIEILKEKNVRLENLLNQKNGLPFKQKNYNEIYNNAPIPISIINKNGKTEYINQIFKDTFGYTLKDISTTELWFKKAYPDKAYREKINSSWNRVVKYSKNIHTEMRTFKVTCKSGKVKDIIFKLAELDDERYILLLEDVSERIKAENALRKSEEKFRRILENIPLIGLMLDLKGRIIFCNQYLLNLSGWKLREIVNKDWFKVFIPKDNRKQIRKIFTDIVTKQKKQEHYENEIITKSGERKCISWSNVVIFDAAGNFENVTSIGEDITGKKENEQELKIRDDRFNTFIAQTTDAVNCWEFDKKVSVKAPIKKQIKNIFDGILVECNDNFAKVYGYKSAKDVLGKRFRELIKDGEGNIEELFTRFIKNNYKIGNEESVEILKTGQKKYLLNNAHGVFENGCLTRIWVTIKDITEIKKAEKAVKENEERFKGLFENATVGIYRTSPSGEILMANPALLKMLGYNSFEEIAKRNVSVSGYVNLDDRVYFQRIMDKFGEIKGFESEWWKNDNTIIYLRESATAIKNNKGEILYYEGTVEDITDKKKAETELLKNELKYKALFNLSPSGIMLADLNGTMIDANPAFCNSLGYSQEEIIGKNVRIIAAPENLDEVDKHIKLLNEGKTLKHTVKDLTKEGAYRFMDLHETRIPLDENEFGIISVTNDITDRKNFEEELIKAKEKAEKSDRLKTEFLAQISHEIRTPINSILSFTSYLHDEFKDSEITEIDDVFDIIHKAGNRITRTIDMILNMSEIQTGSYEPSPKKIDLYENIIKPISAGFKRHVHNKKIKFTTNNKTDNAVITGDEYTLNQIFDNLLNNAFKYTPSGNINVTVGRNGKNKLYTKISDTGIGISEEFLNIIFEPFSQEEQGYTRRFEGNGLGLALVKKYCDINNVEINVKSKKGTGTTFTLIFN